MAILEKKINPSLRLKIRDAYQQGKKDSDLVNQLLISEGKGGSPNTPTPDWDKDWPKPGTKPREEARPNIPTKLANFLTPSRSGRTISDEAYWDGLNTILNTTEAGSHEQNKRLNTLMHQFQDQVKRPQTDLKIAELDPLSDYDVTDKGLYMNYMGDMFMNLDGMLFPMGQGYDEGTHGKLVPKGLVQNNAADGLKIAQNKTPSQQNATNMVELMKKLTKEGKHIEAQALYKEQFPRA